MQGEKKKDYGFCGLLELAAHLLLVFRISIEKPGIILTGLPSHVT